MVPGGFSTDQSEFGTPELVGTQIEPPPVQALPGTVTLAEQIVAANESSEAVRGTVESETFVNTIAGRLRILGIPILIPETTMPHSLSTRRQYRILLEADKLRSLRVCFDGKSADSKLPGDVDQFLDSVFGWPGKDPSSIVRLLSADLLAQQLHLHVGIGTPELGRNSPDNANWRHILWVRALESGGSVIKRERFWGTKIRYSGGSVVTYALTTLNGPLECSGSFDEYGGPMAAKDFNKSGTLAEADIPLSGGCRALINRQISSGVHQLQDRRN